MRSSTPKVLHALAGRSLLDHVLAATDPLKPPAALSSSSGTAGSRSRVRWGSGTSRWCRSSRTAPATRSGSRCSPSVRESWRTTSIVVVVPGDAPLLTADTLAALVDLHARTRAAATLLTAEVPDPTGYGRVVRNAAGDVLRRRRGAGRRRRDPRIREVATSVYAFAAGPLLAALARITTDNAQAEEYLTDVVELLVAEGLPVAAHLADDAAETAGVNDRVQLAAAGRMLRDRLLRGGHAGRA